MILPSILVVFILASLLLLRWFSSLSRSVIWRRATFLSLGIAVVRVFLSFAGRLLLMTESGWLQIPAFLMALISLPEAALAPQTHDLNIATSMLLGVLILLGTSLWVFAIAGIAHARKKRIPDG